MSMEEVLRPVWEIMVLTWSKTPTVDRSHQKTATATIWMIPSAIARRKETLATLQGSTLVRESFMRRAFGTLALGAWVRVWGVAAVDCVRRSEDWPEVNERAGCVAGDG